MKRGDNLSAFTDGTGKALDRSRAYVADREYVLACRFERLAVLAGFAAGQDEAFAIKLYLRSFQCLRHGGQQVVHVEHVHVNDGGQAVIGNLKEADTPQ